MAQMAVELSPTDLARMNALLQALPDTYARQAQSAGMRAYARVVRKDAKATTAFRDRTGTLRGSIGVGRRSSRSRGRKIRGAGAVVFASAPHAHLIELGTSRIARAAVSRACAGADAAAGTACRRVCYAAEAACCCSQTHCSPWRRA